MAGLIRRKRQGEQTEQRREPSWAVSLIPFIVLTLSLVVVISIFGADALSGGSQVCLLLASAVTAAISMFAYRTPWEVLEDCILDNIRSVGSAILILLLIGAIAGTWMVSGIVPAMICYGMKVIFPSVFLAANEGHFPFGIPCCGMCDQRLGVRDDRKFMDYDSHNRRGFDRNRYGAGIRTGLDGRSHHFRSLFRG